ncbi:hypothetical protein CQY22_005130 [Mycolicibacterium brumae]|uniref:Uncharacterized protein n=2 Tax=Mycolicibacterium brumae TaxID=85968 RepID=A0A2G5PDW3_9MYCO|nr:hypothetical protein CQY22_005130 [Mycolicibacterium brumae]RWA23411.1 hypothetical protein MBRU_00910 [Mycolicibacterium brumae DSM 44177]
MAAGTALTAATTAPVAAADVIFVRCSFSVDQPFVYELNGASYVGARMRADNCETNLPSTPLKFGLDIQAGYGTQDAGVTESFTNAYEKWIDVSNGGSYVVDFPSDDRLVALRPGVFLASGRVSSNIEGWERPKFIDAKAVTWGVDWGTMTRIG